MCVNVLDTGHAPWRGQGRSFAVVALSHPVWHVAEPGKAMRTAEGECSDRLECHAQLEPAATGAAGDGDVVGVGVASWRAVEDEGLGDSVIEEGALTLADGVSVAPGVPGMLGDRCAVADGERVLEDDSAGDSEAIEVAVTALDAVCDTVLEADGLPLFDGVAPLDLEGVAVAAAVDVPDTLGEPVMVADLV